MQTNFLFIYDRNGDTIYSRCFDTYCEVFPETEQQLEKTIYFLSQSGELFDTNNHEIKSYQIEAQSIFFHVVKPLNAIISLGIEGTHEENIVRKFLDIICKKCRKNPVELDSLSTAEVSEILDPYFDHYEHDRNELNMKFGSCNSVNCPFVELNDNRTGTIWDNIRDRFT